MKFKFTENLDEDLKSKYGFSFEDLMKAAMDGDGDFVLNPPGVTGVINLSKNQWENLYDAMFDTDEDDRIYNGDEWDREVEDIHKFGDRYNGI